MTMQEILQEKLDLAIKNGHTPSEIVRVKAQGVDLSDGISLLESSLKIDNELINEQMKVIYSGLQNCIIDGSHYYICYFRDHIVRRLQDQLVDIINESLDDNWTYKYHRTGADGGYSRHGEWIYDPLHNHKYRGKYNIKKKERGGLGDFISTTIIALICIIFMVCAVYFSH
jgi:hypothetical protein